MSGCPWPKRPFKLSLSRVRGPSTLATNSTSSAVGYFHSADSRTYLPSSTAVLRKTIQLCFTRQDTCARKIEMKKRKDPPGYPGDEAILKAFGDALRDVRIEKGLSLEQADAVFQEALKKDLYPRLPRALGILVSEVRQKQNIARQQLSDAAGLPCSC